MFLAEQPTVSSLAHPLDRWLCCTKKQGEKHSWVTTALSWGSQASIQWVKKRKTQKLECLNSEGFFGEKKKGGNQNEPWSLLKLSERVSQYNTSFIEFSFATFLPSDLTLYLTKGFMYPNGSNVLFVSLNVFSVTTSQLVLAVLLKLINRTRPQGVMPFFCQLFLPMLDMLMSAIITVSEYGHCKVTHIPLLVYMSLHFWSLFTITIVCCKRRKMLLFWLHIKWNRKIKSRTGRKLGSFFSHNAKKSEYLYDKSHHS